ncbi:sulfatase-like hydrolase/transferase [Mariniblastus fucicola]|uniref:Arylsulfatase n=1 Tax=Mariniblastus fucicola TaxID=980251 RepID=A0A5B9PH08_9BACT|nr:sulfatase-like hydrolase/transferase [Mariniblastus fucicola]QEG24889.1 Arylsulfatase [Mariniblastus fucicola]
MNRSLFALFVIIFAFALADTIMAQDQPNIIFLMTDDQRCDNLGCYGRPEFKTTNIDHLARQGVVFDNAYYAVSICMPSRVTMMTGRFISSHQVGFSPPYDHTLSQSDFRDSYPAQLKAARYRTGFIGKFGFNVTEISRRPNGNKGYDFEKQLKEYFDFFAGDGTHTGGESKVWPQEDAKLVAIYDRGRKNTGRTLRNGEAMLHFLDTQPKDVPFCLSVSFLAVKHDSNSHMHAPHFDLFKDHEFSVPENWVEGANEKLPKVVKENWRGSPLHVQRSSTPELYQRQVRRFAAQGYTVDQQVGLMMDKLEEKGLLQNTVVIYTSDNGRFQGSHGLFDKALLYEESMKEPLIVFDGRKPESQRGRREDAMISSVDIAPTILSLAGVQPPESMQGNDFSKILNQTQDMSLWPRVVFMENLFLVSLRGARNKPNAVEINEKAIARNKSYRCHGVRTKRWKYFVYYEHDPKIEELYDLQADPFEQNNLVDDPAFEGTVKKLRKQTEKMYSRALE